MTDIAAEDLLVDPYPDVLEARREARDRFLAASASAVAGVALEFVIETLSRWNQGQTIRVAFLEGPTELHREIEQTAKKWTAHCNLTLDFGFDPDTGRYRSWSPGDTAPYKADIRIAFHTGLHPLRGYWSMVGTDSIDPFIAGPGEASMNFGGFLNGIPNQGQATIIHEFGHALGFHHEHQHPTAGCEREFRWEDDPGYVPTTNASGGFIADGAGRQPGLYTVLGGPPNNWPKSRVDFNLRQLRDTSAFMTGPFDVRSIMKYSFPEWMFRGGAQSPCFSPRNVELSAQDIAGISQAYPKAEAQAAERTAEQRGILESVASDSALPPETKERIDSQLESLP